MPEPSTIILIGSGLLGLAGFRLRRKKPGHSSAKRIFVTRWKHPLAMIQPKKETRSAGEKKIS
ncbi:MAG: PEP-CTERM sorting domain-containing protein [Deltaproteobacteria bacterium]|nr:PEP-CTERM sorting domain-containing protein [Deltaproteobacteria bacterium]